MIFIIFVIQNRGDIDSIMDDTYFFFIKATFFNKIVLDVLRDTHFSMKVAREQKQIAIG